MANKSSVEQLNSFLRGEISAVETYEMALEKLDEISPTRDELMACLQSHQDRVQLLTEMIIDLGGEPAQSSGPWGVFAKTVEGGAKVLGEKATIAALEEGEDHGIEDYEDEVKDEDLDPASRNVVMTQLLPMQRQTHDRISALKHRM
jgi:uncharacterized protein (TIGR02284 family)